MAPWGFRSSDTGEPYGTDPRLVTLEIRRLVQPIQSLEASAFGMDGAEEGGEATGSPEAGVYPNNEVQVDTSLPDLLRLLLRLLDIPASLAEAGPI